MNLGSNYYIITSGAESREILRSHSFRQRLTELAQAGLNGRDDKSLDLGLRGLKSPEIGIFEGVFPRGLTTSPLSRQSLMSSLVDMYEKMFNRLHIIRKNFVHLHRT